MPTNKDVNLKLIVLTSHAFSNLIKCYVLQVKCAKGNLSLVILNISKDGLVMK